MSTNIRFKGITDTTANIAADKFQGRIAWNTTLNRFVVFYDATNYGTMARRDVFETFAAGIRNNGDYQDSLGTVRISSTGLVTGSGVAAADLTTGQAVVTTTGGRLVSQAYATFLGTIGAVGGRGNGAAGRVMRWSDANTATSDAGLTTAQIGGVTNVLVLGETSAGANTTLAVSSPSSYSGSLSWRWGTVTRWAVSNIASTGSWQLRAFDVAGGEIDQPVTIANAASGLMTLGGATARPLKLTGVLQDSGGNTRMSAVGAMTPSTLSVTDQAGTGERLVSASAAGAQSATIAVSAFAKTILDDADAAAVRATIGAAADAGNISHAPLFTGRRTVNCPNGVETAVTPAYTLPANWWQTGKRLRVELCLFAAHNATVLVYIGSRYFATFSVVGPFRGEIVAELVCQSTGASGRFAFLGWTEVASTSGYGATYHAMNSPLFGDSQASADGIGDNWTIDTTASADVVVKIASSYGENIPMPYGSVSIYNP